MESCTYDRVIVLYSRTQLGDLIQCFGGEFQTVGSYWSVIQQRLVPQELNSYRTLSNLVFDEPSFPHKLVNIHEYRLPHSSITVGMVLRPASIEPSMLDFDEYFCILLLHRIARVSEALIGKEVVEDLLIAEQVVDFCNDELLFHPPNSQWESVGRDCMLQRISFFTSRGLPIEMCLPAFPCKSSNPDKVAGALPDRGEELALRRLYSVSRRMKTIYEPGMRICIVSDGHVFSDCSE